jgi:hypothetical protein
VECVHGGAFRMVVVALGLPPERIVIEAPLAASNQPDLLAFVLRNYRNNGFRVAINLDSLTQWQGLSSLTPADLIKIDSARLLVDEDWRDRLACLATLHSGAKLVVTRLEHMIDAPLPPGVFVQGYAYGLPAQRAAIMRAERHALDRFAY